jgi:ubiquitin carboxyl-terminal hydrolase 22/27/51
VAHYKMILRGIFDSAPIVPQTSKSADNTPITSLTSNYLCLQCPTTLTEEDRLKHGTKKSHRFCEWANEETGPMYIVLTLPRRGLEEWFALLPNV